MSVCYGYDSSVEYHKNHEDLLRISFAESYPYLRYLEEFSKGGYNTLQAMFLRSIRRRNSAVDRSRLSHSPIYPVLPAKFLGNIGIYV